MRLSGCSSLKTLVLGITVSGALSFGMAGAAFAGYSSTGGTTVTGGSGYQANSAYAQSAGSQTSGLGGANTVTTTTVSTPSAMAPATVQQPGIQQPSVAQDNAVYTNGYTGPMGPNAEKAFESGTQPAAPVAMAQAQTMAPNGSPIVNNPQQVQACVCMQTRYELLATDRSAKEAAYTQAVSQRADLDTQIATAKAGPSSPDQVNRIRDLNAHRIALQQQINQRYIPDLQTSTGNYNSAVGQYQQSCGGKTFDSDVLARVKTGLVCQGS